MCIRDRTFRNRLNNVFDVIDRIRNTSVFCYALISEVDLTVSVNCYVFKLSVTFDSVIDIRFAVFIQVEDVYKRQDLFNPRTKALFFP